jgi:hypothetical protein
MFRKERIQALTKIEVFTPWQMAYFAMHDFHVKVYGNRIYMVRPS